MTVSYWSMGEDEIATAGAASGVNVSSNILGGNTGPALYDNRLGRRHRFAGHTFYVRNASAGSAENRKIEVDIGGGAVGGNGTRGQYTGTTLASHYDAILKILDATFTCTWSAATRKFTIARTGNFELHANQANSILPAMGFTATNHTGAATYTSDAVAPNMGHSIYVDFAGTKALKYLALEGPRIAITGGDTARPSTKPTELKVLWWSSAHPPPDPSTLGTGSIYDPETWAGTTANWTIPAAWPPNATTPQDESEIVLMSKSAASSAHRHHYFLFYSAEAADEMFPWLELGLFAAWPEAGRNDINSSSAGTLTPLADHRRRVVLPGTTADAHLAGQYTSSGKPHWEFDLPFATLSATEQLQFQAMARDLGRSTPAIFAIDGTIPTTGAEVFSSDNGYYYCTLGGDLSFAYRAIDNRSMDIVLQHQRGGAPLP